MAQRGFEVMIKIAVTGPESTGKSTLAKDLAKYFKINAVPEYAREYLKNFAGDYTIDDVITIAEGQQKLISEREMQNPNILIADTELIVCKIWTEYVYNTTPDFIEKALSKQKFDFYLLCDIDLPWTYDPLRENPNLDERKDLFQRYKSQLDKMKAPYGIVSGSGETRFQNALNHIKPLLK